MRRSTFFGEALFLVPTHSQHLWLWVPCRRSDDARYAHVQFQTATTKYRSRHCERKRSNPWSEKEWIAWSLTLPCANASRLSQAMTEVIEIRVRDLAAQPREFCFELSAI
jgi:hypothetical protein